MSLSPRLILALLLGPLLGSPLSAEQLVLHGSNTIGERLAPNAVTAWLETRGCTLMERKSPKLDHLVLLAACAGKPLQIDIHAYGTGTGFSELLAGRADLWMASRPVNADELSRAKALARLDEAPFENVIALDGLSVIVHPGQQVRAISMAQLQGVFAGQITRWRELGGSDAPISLYARDDKSGTFDSFKAMVLGGSTLSAQARRFESSEQLTQAVLDDPNGIGFVGLAAVGKSRTLAIADGSVAAQAPSVASVLVEDYALSRRLYLYAGPGLSALGHEFLGFISSDRGQNIVERTGFVGLGVRNVPHAANAAAPREYLDDIVQDAKRLGVNVRFEEQRSNLDARAVRDMDRLIEFMLRPEQRGKRLRVAGFADTREFSRSISRSSAPTSSPSTLADAAWWLSVPAASAMPCPSPVTIRRAGARAIVGLKSGWSTETRPHALRTPRRSLRRVRRPDAPGHHLGVRCYCESRSGSGKTPSPMFGEGWGGAGQDAFVDGHGGRRRSFLPVARAMNIIAGYAIPGLDRSCPRS